MHGKIKPVPKNWPDGQRVHCTSRRARRFSGTPGSHLSQRLHHTRIRIALKHVNHHITFSGNPPLRQFTSFGSGRVLWGRQAGACHPGSRRGPRPKAGLRGVTLDVRGGMPHLSKAGLRVPSRVNGIATRVFGRDHGLPDPLAGRALSPQAVEGTTARGRLRSQARSLVAHSVPTPTQDFGRGRASSPGQGKEDFASELPWGIRPDFLFFRTG